MLHIMRWIYDIFGKDKIILANIMQLLRFYSLNKLIIDIKY